METVSDNIINISTHIFKKTAIVFNIATIRNRAEQHKDIYKAAQPGQRVDNVHDKEAIRVFWEVVEMVAIGYTHLIYILFIYAFHQLIVAFTLFW